jgi:hypothetical protein
LRRIATRRVSGLLRQRKASGRNNRIEAGGDQDNQGEHDRRLDAEPVADPPAVKPPAQANGIRLAAPIQVAPGTPTVTM